MWLGLVDGDLCFAVSHLREMFPLRFWRSRTNVFVGGEKSPGRDEGRPLSILVLKSPDTTPHISSEPCVHIWSVGKEVHIPECATSLPCLDQTEFTRSGRLSVSLI
jgi:hypothetical protein